jgi:hypothetical protein
MKSTTKLTYRDKNFLRSASSNGIFVDLFSINGWLLQIFAVDILLAHDTLVGSLVLAYPIIMVLELCALALVACVDYRKFLFYSFAIRGLLVVGMLITAYRQTVPTLVPILYYTAFFFHIAGFHVCWPLFVKNQITPDRRGRVLGLARAYTNLLSLTGLALIFIAGKYAPDSAAFVGLGLAVFASIVSLTGLRVGYARTNIQRGTKRGRTSEHLLQDLFTFMHRLASDGNFRKAMTETLSLGLVTLPMPLFYLPQTGLIGQSVIILAFIVGTFTTIAVYPAFGKFMDRSRERAYVLALVSGVASMMAAAAALSLRDSVPSYIVSAAVLAAVASNFISSRLAGLFSYTRALDVGNHSLAAASTLVIAWVFDLAAWLVVAAMHLLPRFGQTPDIGWNYSLVCVASTFACGIFVLLSRWQQTTQHA